MDSNLRSLYEAALAEDRFQVQLNWDRTKFALTLNGTILAAGVALTNLGNAPVARALAAAVFVAGAIAAAFGIKATREGKAYHRVANAKKVLYEEALGLAALGTEGREHDGLALSGVKRSKRRRILSDVDAYVNVRVDAGSITGAAVALLWALMVLDALGALAVAFVVAGCPGAPPACG